MYGKISSINLLGVIAAMFLVGSYGIAANAQPANMTSTADAKPLTSQGYPMVMTLQDTITGGSYEYVVNTTADVKEVLTNVVQSSEPGAAGLEDPFTQLDIDATVAAIGDFSAGNATQVSVAAVEGEEGEDADVSGLFSFISKVVQKVKKPLDIGMKVGRLAMTFAPLIAG